MDKNDKKLIIFGVIALAIVIAGIAGIIYVLEEDQLPKTEFQEPFLINGKTYTISEDEQTNDKIQESEKLRDYGYDEIPPKKVVKNNYDHYIQNDPYHDDYWYYQNYRYHPKYYYNYSDFDEDLYPCIVYDKHTDEDDSIDCWTYEHGGVYQYPYWRLNDYYKYPTNTKYYYQYPVGDYPWYYYPNKQEYNYWASKDLNDYKEYIFLNSNLQYMYPDTKRHLLNGDYYRYHYEDGNEVDPDRYAFHKFTGMTESRFEANDMEFFLQKSNEAGSLADHPWY